MKKILLSSAALFLTVFCINAQSFTLVWNGDPYYDGDTIHFEADSSTVTEMVFEPILNNNTNNGINIEVIRDELLMLEGTVSYFCWDTCYQPFVDSSVMSLYIPAGSSSTDGDFIGHYEVNGAVGVSLIEYKYYNKDNPAEYIAIVVKFDISPAGIDDNIFNNIWVSEIYPNPTITFVNIDYELPTEVDLASVKIVNLYGSVMMERELDAGSNHMRMNVSELNGGIYFYSVIINGEIYNTKKLIIR